MKAVITGVSKGRVVLREGSKYESRGQALVHLEDLKSLHPDVAYRIEFFD